MDPAPVEPVQVPPTAAHVVASSDLGQRVPGLDPVLRVAGGAVSGVMTDMVIGVVGPRVVMDGVVVNRVVMPGSVVMAGSVVMNAVGVGR